MGRSNEDAPGTDERSQQQLEKKRELQRLEQEAQTFQLQKQQAERWFRLRLTMGYVSAFFLPAITGFCMYVLFKSSEYPSYVVHMASGTLFIDVVGFLVSVWKVALNPGSVEKLKPVTEAKLSLPAEPNGVPSQKA